MIPCCADAGTVVTLPCHNCLCPLLLLLLLLLLLACC
jgi:hypothetical protein